MGSKKMLTQSVTLDRLALNILEPGAKRPKENCRLLAGALLPGLSEGRCVLECGFPAPCLCCPRASPRPVMWSILGGWTWGKKACVDPGGELERSSWQGILGV